MKPAKFLIAFTVALLFYMDSYAQGNFWESKDAYLGQTPPNDTPKIFAKGIIADTDSWAGDRVAFSADGKEFYYSHNNSWFSVANQKLKYFKYNNGKWNGPLVLTGHHYAPTFSPDGDSMYIIGGVKKGDGDAVWQLKRTDTGWTAPAVYIHTAFGLYDFTPTKSGNIYVGSNARQGKVKDFSTYDFCRMTISGKDTVINSLGIPLNAPGFNGDFFIDPDEQYMIISDKETTDFKAEIYISFHKPDDTWTNPKSLGPLINNGVADRWGEYVSPDHKYLFYTQGTNAKNCFLYWVRFDKMLERLKHTNFEPYVKNPVKDVSVKAGGPFSIQIPPNTFFDDDGNNTLTYSAKLNDGQPLPDGLKFDAPKMMFKGIVKSKAPYIIKLTATDNANTSTSCIFNITATD